MVVIDLTHSPEWAHSLAATQQRFVADLEAAGFVRVPEDSTWEGELEVTTLSGATQTAHLEIGIGDAFPFEPPRVVDALMLSARTWHHNPDWSLCLYGTHDVGDRPWQDVSQLLSRVRHWFDSAAAGWPDDPPDLDLERYFGRVDAFITYEDIELLIGKPVSAIKKSATWFQIDREGYLPAKQRSRRQGRNRWWGWAGDLGELDAPVVDWPTIQERIGDQMAVVDKRVRSGDYAFLALRYQRQGHTGVVVLFPWLVDGLVTLKAGTAAANDAATRQLRAGDPETVKVLSEKTVAIVGVGAVGSFLAEMLARSGVGALHLVDGDKLRPGNCIRHLASQESVGRPKAEAVRGLLVERELISADAIRATETMLDSGLAAELLDEADVVIDATANDNARGLLVHLQRSASDIGIRSAVVSVAVHRSGGIIRTDRWPRRADFFPAPIPAHPDGELELREGSCGDPVSATPATSVMEAAALASRHTVDLLAGANAMPDSVVAVLAEQPDAPYQSLGVITS